MRSLTCLPLITVLTAGLAAVCLPAPHALAATTDCAFDPAVGATANVRVLGVPRARNGAVDVRAQNGPTQRILGAKGTGFGTSVATAFVDDDHCPDLAVGAPTASGGGKVEIFLGTASGFAPTPAVVLHARSRGDRFGSDVAVRERPSGGVDVWVGAPGRTVAGHKRAGAVDHFLLTTQGASRRLETITAASASAGRVQSTAEFGSVFAASPEGLLVGVPGQDVDRRKDAGAAYWYPVDSTTGTVGNGTMWTQASPRVAGSPERGDHFGAAVAMSRAGSPRWILVGVPEEDLGGKKDAGSVQTFTLDLASRALSPASAVDETQAGAGTSTTSGNRFGTAVAVDDGTCLSGGWLVGAPGSDAGKATDAGAFFSIGTPGTTCSSMRYSQRDLSQNAEKGDRFGSTLATLGRPQPDLEPLPLSQAVLVGAPGEDSAAGVRDSGSVTTWMLAEQRDEEGKPYLTPVYQYFSYSAGAGEELAYGSVLPDSDTFVRH